jgi:hypothetical protein
MKKILIVLVTIVAGYFAAIYFLEPVEGDIEGGVTIILIDEDGEVISDVRYDFEEETTLFQLLDREYDLACASSSYQPDETCSFVQLNSHILLEIDELKTNWTTSYIQILIDDTPSNYGVDRILLTDNTSYTFKYVDLGGGN